MRSHNKLAKAFVALLAVAVAVLLPIGVLASTATTATASTQIITVGYVENAGMIQTPFTSGSEGYGYEYLEKILEYTEGDYALHFVACTRDEAYDLLASGEIDLFGLTGYDESLAAEGYVYTQNDFGNNILFLAATNDVSIDSDTYEKLEGTTIGSIVNKIYVEDFLAEYGRSAQIIELYSAEYADAFSQYNLDFCVVSSLQFPEDESINILSQIDVVPVYLVATEENQALIDDIDQAMDTIEKKEYHYQESTYSKYYDYDVQMDSFISSEEYALLQDQDVYYVGLRNLNAPFSYKNSDGSWDGVAIDFLSMLAEAADITIEVVEIYDNTTAEALAGLDFYLFANEVEAASTRSEEYLSASLILVDHSETISTADTIGVLSYYGIAGVNNNGTVLGRTATVYDSLTELVAGMNSGDVDSILVTTATLNYIRSDLEDENFLSTTLDASVSFSMYYAAGMDEDKIDLLDKIIFNLDETLLEYSLLESASRTVNVGLLEYVQSNPALLLGAIVAILLLAGIMDDRRRRAISKRNNYDPVTGLYSQRRFAELVQERITRHGRWHKYRIVSVDIDNFKYINEIYGYEAGTMVLKRVSAAIKESLPKEAIFARAYADNFLIMVRRAKKEEDYTKFAIHADSLNEKLSRILGTSYRFSFSVGFYDIPEARVPVNYMIDCANVARSLGKNTIGTTFQKFSEEINIERAKNNEIVANMEQALQTGEFVLYYQPKIDLQDEHLMGAEALVRWKRGDKMVAPMQFIPLFEKNGFIQRLDFAVLDMACAFIAKNKEVMVAKISVNLSGVTVARDHVVEEIGKVLEKHGVQPSQIDIEITETAFVGNEIAQKTVAALEQVGYSISMDDFGVGISSLSRLKNLEIDTLKIDRLFITDYLVNEKGAVILKSILGMAKSLGMETVAEGIETREQLESLRRYGCDVGQGYYFSRPIPEKDFLVLCKKEAARKKALQD